MEFPYKGRRVRYGSEEGTVYREGTRLGGSEARNVWVRLDSAQDTEIMFSHRGDAEWRAFPGAANGQTLELLPYVIPGSVAARQQTAEKGLTK